MNSDALSIQDARAADANRRQSGRVHVGGVRCNRGRVVDLSPRGARILTLRPWRDGEARLMTLRFGGTVAIVQARCVWRRREGMLRHMVGVSFDACAPEQASALAEIARCCSSVTDFKFAA